MIWHEPSLLIILFTMLALSLAFIILYFTNERQKYLLAWSAAWGVYFLKILTLLVGASFHNSEESALMVGEIFGAINCYLILYGIHLYDRKPINPLWLVSFLITCFWILIIHFFSVSFIIKSFPESIFFFTAYSYTGYLFIKGIKTPTIERMITGVLLILWGIHRLDFPFIWTDERFRFHGFISGATLNIFISLFTILTYLQETRRLFMSEKIKAEESEKMKSSFLANMSHEIRTPLNAILGFTQLLGKPELLPGDKNTFIQNIQSSGEKLMHLLDDILDLSKIQANALKIYLSDVSINRIVDEVISAASLSRKVAENRIKLTAVKPLKTGEDIIRTDEKRLYQILSNLMNNAIKFTDNGTITTGYDFDEPGFVRFFIRDTGIGISPESMDRIFTPFFQEEKVPAAGGTGLGLTIAKGLAESLGGQFSIDSSPDQGTEASFTIHYNRGEKLMPDSSQSRSPDNKMTGKKILLVEDEPINRKLIEKFIESTGAELLSTESGVESVSYCMNDSSIDLVLMDITLPDIDGYTAMAKIKKTRPNLPIIVQSANAMPEHRERAKEAGADGFIAKPIKREELYNAISSQIFDSEGN